MAPCELARTEPASPSSHCPHLKGLRKKVISPVGAAKHLTEEITLMYESLAHTKYMCKYHVVFIPKYRKKIIFQGYSSLVSPEIQGTRSAKRLPN